MLAKLRWFAYDDMCHLRRYLEIRRHEDPVYERLLALHLVVDKMHILNHKTRNDDGKLTYCGKWCDPRSKRHREVLVGRNTEACEQTFRWFGRFRFMANNMTKGRFNFFLRRMCHYHNLRHQRKAGE